MIASSYPRRPSIRAGLTGLCIATFLGALPVIGQPVERQDSRQAAAAFGEKIEAFIDSLAVERDRVDVRINRCEGSGGEMRDDIYAVWVGVQLLAENDDAGQLLAAVADNWRDRGFQVFRDRVLANGGVNIAATDPATGESYSLDSGFPPYPQRYIVGYFSTPCLEEPSGAAPFGPVVRGSNR